LDEGGRLHPDAAPGRLEGNPVHEDLLEAVAYCPPDLLVQLVEPEPGEAAVLQIGDWEEVHRKGCALFLKGHELEHTLPPDLLVADAGGTPRDATFLQAHKSLQHAARFLAPGGRLLLVAALGEGVGSEMLEQLWSSDASALTSQAVTDYQLHTHTALALRTVCERFTVAVWSRMAPDRLRPAGIVPIGTEAEADRHRSRGVGLDRNGWHDPALGMADTG
jgi:nickel-dependent lactate racemase